MEAWEIFLLILVGVLTIVSIAYIVFSYYLEKMYTEINKNMDKLNELIEKRYDILPNFLALLSEIAPNHSIIVRIEHNRIKAMSGETRNDIMRRNQRLTLSLGDLQFLAEEFPKLKESEPINIFRAQLSAIANNIFHYKQKINDSILLYNYRLDTLPFSVFAKIAGLKKREYLSILPQELSEGGENKKNMEEAK